MWTGVAICLLMAGGRRNKIKFSADRPYRRLHNHMLAQYSCPASAALGLDAHLLFLGCSTGKPFLLWDCWVVRLLRSLLISQKTMHTCCIKFIDLTTNCILQTQNGGCSSTGGQWSQVKQPHLHWQSMPGGTPSCGLGQRQGVGPPWPAPLEPKSLRVYLH